MTFKFNVLLMIFPISTDNNQPKLPHPNVIWFYTLSYYKLQHHKYLRPNLAHLSIDIVKLKNIRFQRLSNRWEGDSLKADPWVWTKFTWSNFETHWDPIFLNIFWILIEIGWRVFTAYGVARPVKLHGLGLYFVFEWRGWIKNNSK